MKKTLSILAIAFLGGLISVGIQHFCLEPKTETVFIEQPNYDGQTVGNSAISNLPNLTAAAEMTVDAVVHVRSDYKSQRPGNAWHDLFWGLQEGENPKSQGGSSAGSGVIISTDGYIVTNNHVIDAANEVHITLNDNRRYKAALIGTDPTTDIALLKIDIENLPFIKFSNSDNAKIGQWVLAVGNPFNLTSTVTAGIVSAKGRSINIINKRSAIESFIQTDAVVNPGNSGGALVNTAGALVGINTAISTHTGSFEGYSFAVPSNMVKKVVDDLMEFGVAQRAFIGVSISNLNAKLIAAEDLDISEGVYIAAVSPDGAAATGGIERKDIVIAIDGNKVTKASELQEMIGRKRPGDKVAVTVVRDGKEKDFLLTLKNANNTTAIVKPA
ncbi:MAG: serine protease Do [Flavobacteriales bacterium]|jgi:serine protease Do